MRKRLLFTIAVFALLTGLFAVAAAASDPLPAGCAVMYTVRRGDTLHDLAAAYGVPLPQLFQANQTQVQDADLIYPGQVLCIPAAGPYSDLGARMFALEATYRYALTDTEKGWNLTARGGLVGRRVAYPVTQVDFFSTTEELPAILQADPAPLLMAYRNGPDAITYTLVAIADPRVITSLAMTEDIQLADVLPTIPRFERTMIEDTLGGHLQEKLSSADLDALIAYHQTTCSPVPVTELGQGKAEKVNLTVMLNNPEGVYFPFEVTDIAWRPSVAEASECYLNTPDRVGFLLFPAGSGTKTEFRVVMRLSGTTIGPPGITRAERCRYWPRGGWFYRWLRAWFGCSR